MFENLMWELKGAASAGIMSLAKTGKHDNGKGELKKGRFHGLNMAVKKLNVLDTFNRLIAIGTPETEAEKDANLIFDCKYLGLDLLDDNCIDTIVSRTGFSKDDITEARYSFQLLAFLKENGITSLEDLEFVGMISSLLNTEQGGLKDCDTVAAEHGLPLESVIYVSSLLKKFGDDVNQPLLAKQAPAGDSGNQKRKPPKTKPIAVGDPNVPQGAPTP